MAVAETATSGRSRRSSGRLLDFYWMLGPHDAAGIMEVPDAETATAVSLCINASGAVAHVQSHRLWGEHAQEALRLRPEIGVAVVEDAIRRPD